MFEKITIFLLRVCGIFNLSILIPYLFYDYQIIKLYVASNIFLLGIFLLFCQIEKNDKHYV